MTNRLREALSDGPFAVTVEVVTPSRDRPLADALAPSLALAGALADEPRVVALSVTDRIRSDDDHDPGQAAVLLKRASGLIPLVHLSGKDRSPEQFARALGGLAEAGIDNVLCVSGDRLKSPPTQRRVRYLDSVEAIAVARRLWSDAFIGAAVSPYKYTEEETRTQYLKMARKQAAGAAYLVTQVGWDMRKLEELMQYRRRRGFMLPVIANVMALPPGAARRLHSGGVPGVVVTDDLRALVELEAQTADGGRAARWTRLALQVVGAQRLGYAGAQLSGLTRAEDVRRVLDLADEWRSRVPTLASWVSAWESVMRRPDGGLLKLDREPGYLIFDSGSRASLRPAERRRYHAMAVLHRVVFDPRSPLFPALSRAARRIPPESCIARTLASLEGALKGPLLGCERCGTCRLPETFYVCPETCPKGLANGPCGGSRDNRCEAGDRECVHARIYRLAKAAGQLDRLERSVVPLVPEPRGGSSWLRHFTSAWPARAERIHP